MNPSQYLTADRKGKYYVYPKVQSVGLYRSDGKGGSTAILILPIGQATPKYRDEPNAPPAAVSSSTPNYLASMLGLPQLVVPIDQLPYESPIRGRTEHLPIAGTVVGAKVSDSILVNLAKEAFSKAQWPTSVLTGRYTFALVDQIVSSANVASEENT